jgi:hypothetical protein
MESEGRGEKQAQSALRAKGESTRRKVTHDGLNHDPLSTHDGLVVSG